MALATLSNIVTVDEMQTWDSDAFTKTFAMLKQTAEGSAWLPQAWGPVQHTQVSREMPLAPVPIVDPRDVLYCLERARMRLKKHGWVKSTIAPDGRICLGTALGMFDNTGYDDHSVPAHVAQRAVQREIAARADCPRAAIHAWNDSPATTFNDVIQLLDNVIEATLELLAKSA